MGALSSGERVADVGCGAGIDSLIAAQMVGPTGQVIGVDMTPAMLAKAAASAAEAKVEHAEFRSGYGESLPIPDGWADVVISNGVFNLMPVDKYLPAGAGAVFSFDCRGGRQAGQDFIRGVALWSHLANVGDSKSLIIHPASTTHRQLNDDEFRAAGVGPGTIRLSVGIENVDDLIWDLDQGFSLAAASVDTEVASS